RHLRFCRSDGLAGACANVYPACRSPMFTHSEWAFLLGLPARRRGREVRSIAISSRRDSVENMSTSNPQYTVPGLSSAEGDKVAGILQERLAALIDLSLTLKHVHWNVVGPHFIAVHEMIDPHVDEVRAMVDETAERIA